MSKGLRKIIWTNFSASNLLLAISRLIYLICLPSLVSFVRKSDIPNSKLSLLIFIFYVYDISGSLEVIWLNSHLKISDPKVYPKQVHLNWNILIQHEFVMKIVRLSDLFHKLTIDNWNWFLVFEYKTLFDLLLLSCFPVGFMVSTSEEITRNGSTFVPNKRQPTDLVHPKS